MSIQVKVVLDESKNLKEGKEDYEVIEVKEKNYVVRVYVSDGSNIVRVDYKGEIFQAVIDDINIENASEEKAKKIAKLFYLFEERVLKGLKKDFENVIVEVKSSKLNNFMWIRNLGHFASDLEMKFRDNGAINDGGVQLYFSAMNMKKVKKFDLQYFITLPEMFVKSVFNNLN